MVSPLTAATANLGLTILQTTAEFGRFSIFALRTFRIAVMQPRSWLRWRTLGPQLYSVGAQSVIVVAITGAFIGMILAIEGYDQFAALGQEQQMGGVINSAVTKQIGPVLAAVMLAGRVGGNIAAELGSMRVTEQLDAMRVMAADPIRTLVVPRVMACVLMLPVLTVYSDIVGSLGAWGVVTGLFKVTNADYWHYTSQFVSAWDPATGLAKSVAFGLAIGLISCYKGFHCNEGAKGVGDAATGSFVASFLVIIMLNLVLASFLGSLQSLLDPESMKTLIS
ncbi:MAG: ABC transporter permease [Planctomycetota bacterium]|jgi:phospholipid/cholesterol/gamma-HCH transport system permease protein|nr:MAG: ABC transporter permease [Planctomycetota bacterium]RLS94105.1 MAG: ABC transporter permease [Planctomycetota bacterium]